MMMTTPLSLSLLLWSACSGPQLSGAFHQVSLSVVTEDAAVLEAFSAAVAGATASVDVLLPGLEDVALAEALIAARDRGLTVRVATDIDAQGQAGLLALEAAAIPLTYANDAVSYFDFAINEDVSWSSAQVVMSHAMLVVDEVSVVSATSLGGGEGARVVWTARGEDIGEDMWLEHNQIFGGSDASSRTAFDSLAKSVSDLRWQYPTQTDHMLEIWLGPQERVIKRIIDYSYMARANIWVMTNDFADEGLIRALYAKRRDGFDVRVLVGPDFGQSAPNLSAILLRETEGLEKRQLPDPVVSTVVLIDTERDRLGRYNIARGMTASHPIWSASRLFAGSEVLTDQLVDGSLWILDDYGEPSGDILTLKALFEDAWNRAEAL